MAAVQEPTPVILPHIQIARAHWLLGALFLAIVLEQYLPLLRSDGRPVESRTVVIPWMLMIGGVGVWATTVFADVVHDMLIHTLWGDILFGAGALELVRRRGAHERPWLERVLPVAFVGTGVLFIVHVLIHATPGDGWHIAMGLLLITGGMLELTRMQRHRPRPAIPLAVLPLSGFALALIAIPVAAAT
jgi:membrane protein CcdC involved in cytochrome C biogenesis